MQHSTNYNMNLPEGYDQFDIGHFNDNTRIIDTQLKAVKDVTDTVNHTSKKLVATLAANATELVFTDPSIGANSLIDVYTSVFGVNPANISQTGNTVTITFTAQTVAIDVAIIVINYTQGA